MKRWFSPGAALSLVLVFCLSIAGVFAVWTYAESVQDATGQVGADMGSFRYGLIYITRAEVTGGSYSSGSVVKAGDTDITAELVLHLDGDSGLVLEVTFYNSTAVSYYYDEAVTVSTDNEGIVPAVSGVEQGEEIPAGSYKTLTVTFGYAGAVTDGALLSQVHFQFTVDKSSIGDIVAETAVNRFLEILNTPASYSQLTEAMDSRSGLNKASVVTYIGNVAGADSGDSQVINALFGEEFMSMDLDGDGNTEPITIMIKREDLDSNSTTGDSYSYTSWGRETTVNGAEMTIYITADSFDNVSSGDSMSVYAAAFTKLSGAEEWIQVVPLTKGTATANRYSGWGGADSFNTDTWQSEDGRTVTALVSEAMAQ